MPGADHDPPYSMNSIPSVVVQTQGVGARDRQPGDNSNPVRSITAPDEAPSLLTIKRRSAPSSAMNSYVRERLSGLCFRCDASAV